MSFLSDWGYWGLFIGSFLASTIVPFSADVLLLACLANRNVWICLALATVGNWLGGITSFYIGWLGNLERIEKWFKVNAEKLRKQKRHIERYNAFLAFFTWLPFVGDVFAIALGFYKVNAAKSALWMFIGRFIRFAAWIVLYQAFAERFVQFVTNFL